VDYGGEYGEAWLRDLLADLADDELVETAEDGAGETVARLRR
jgi:A/G-specific adenine glycosylase